MNFFKVNTSTLLIAILLNIGLANANAQTSYNDQLNIAELLETANENFDLDNEDAVILFDGREEFTFSDGRLRTTVHRIVRISTTYARGRYADHRISYDDAHQTFTVNTLRTWCDNRWWDSDTTGKVTTLPYAVEKAYDYSHMREMMLLHDGIELPCILEWAYVIEDKEPYRKGVDGMWIFAKDDPVVQSSFKLGFPSGQKPRVYKTKDVPRVIKESDSQTGLSTYTYKMSLIPALPSPHTVDPASYSPHVSWSTWNNWDSYGNDLKTAFEARLELNEILKDSLDKLLDDAYAMTDKAQRITAFVSRSIRYVGYSSKHWQWNPRPAHRTFTTAYGHRLDRAILAAALFKKAGFTIFPVLRSNGFGNIEEGVPTQSRMDGIAVWVSGRDEVEAYYNPVTSKIHNGLAPIYGRTVWIPGSGDDPQVSWKGEANISRLEVRLDLEYEEEKDQWDGHGFYKAEQGFNPFDRMEGLDGEARDYLQSVVSGVIDGAEIINYNPVTFNRFTIAIGFEFTAPVGEEDSFGRHSFTIGDPANGIFDHLPNDIELYVEKRDAPIRLAGLMERTVEVSLNVEGLDIVYIPEYRELENDGGSFSISIVEKDEQVVISRQLKVSNVSYSEKDWSLLRSLLLADKNERGRTVFLKKVD